jgi:hypothetical protein
VLYLNLSVSEFNVFLITSLSLRLRADISKVTAHDRIQHLFAENAKFEFLRSNEIQDWEGVGNSQFFCFFKL